MGKTRNVSPFHLFEAAKIYMKCRREQHEAAGCAVKLFEIIEVEFELSDTDVAPPPKRRRLFGKQRVQDFLPR